MLQRKETMTRPKNANYHLVAEFFAGIGLMRMALETANFRVVFANDIDATKERLYSANFGDEDFKLADVRTIRGPSVPDVQIATASFPCTDLSIAGNRAGLKGSKSGLLWEFLRVLKGMGHRRPPVVLLENVVGLVTSHGGRDLHAIVQALNRLGYDCDLLTLDAQWFTPQSRARLFVVASLAPFGSPSLDGASKLRPGKVIDFAYRHPKLRLQWAALPSPPNRTTDIGDVIERLSPTDERWWGAPRLGSFLASLSDVQAARVNEAISGRALTWGAAYRRTRHGSAVWEVRPDNISGCLRTTSGGSSKQAVVEAARGAVRVRWMTAREYARLQGADDFRLEAVTESQALFGLGDAVCVPAVAWLAENYLTPLLASITTQRASA